MGWYNTGPKLRENDLDIYLIKGTCSGFGSAVVGWILFSAKEHVVVLDLLKTILRSVHQVQYIS